jgi:hypothetical protein
VKKHAVSLAIIFIILSLCASLMADEDKFKVSGDFRFRLDVTDEDNLDTRARNNIRVRIALEAVVNPRINAIFRLASGGTNPVSVNQTLTDGFSTKDIRLDLAYFEWSPNQVTGLTLTGGKSKNPYISIQKSELLWDPDMNPEGLAGKYAHTFGQAELFFNAGFFWLEERSQDDDSYLTGIQTGVEYQFPESMLYIIAGGAYYDYIKARGFKPFYNEDNALGNSLDDDGNYLGDYNIINIFMELGTKVRGFPIALFADYANNTAIADDKTGWLAGITIGKANSPGTWSLRYHYKYLEKDAVIGAFTDSNFLNGGTDGKGHEVNFDLGLMKNTSLATTLFFDKLGLDERRDYKRWQLDLKFKF